MKYQELGLQDNFKRGDLWYIKRGRHSISIFLWGNKSISVAKNGKFAIGETYENLGLYDNTYQQHGVCVVRKAPK